MQSVCLHLQHDDYDDKTSDTREYNYMIESYNIYRLELSLYLNNHQDILEKIINIVRNQSKK